MPAVMKKKAVTAKSVEKSTKTSPSPQKQKAFKKKTKPKLISSQLGVTAVKKSKNKNAFDPLKANRGVVFIKHIPHGFYEDQLKSYFEQFGNVTRTRVARSEKSGRSKGFAFVEFRVPEVAQIAAETMDNYLMFKQVLKTAYIPPEEQKFNYFRTSVRMEKDANDVSRLVTAQTQRTDKAVAQANKVPTQKEHENHVERSLYKLKKAQEKYAAKDIDLDLNLVAQNASESSRKTPTKKQNKAAAKAEKAAVKAELTKKKSTKKAGGKSVPVKKEPVDLDNTLTKLISETIEDSSSSDEDYVPELVPILPDIGSEDSDDSDKLSFASSDEEPSEPQNKRKKNLPVPEKTNKKKKLVSEPEPSSSDSEAEMVQEIVIAKKSKKITPPASNKVTSAAAKVALAAAASAKKISSKKIAKVANTTLEQLLNDTIEDEDTDDDDYNASATSASESSAPNTPSPKAKIVKRNRTHIEESMPQIASKKKSSRLVASGGIQKRNKKPISNSVVEITKPNKKSDKLKFAATELIKTKNSPIKKVKANDLKKKPKIP